jgi:hypothetical protein
VNTFSLLEGAFAFSICLMLAGLAMVWATTHFDFIHLLVDFGVVFMKPGKPEDDILLA